MQPRKHPPELGQFRELELFYFHAEQRNNSRYSTLIYDTVNQQGVCWCQTMDDAKSLLLRSGYFRKPLPSGGVCWYLH